MSKLITNAQEFCLNNDNDDLFSRLRGPSPRLWRVETLIQTRLLIVLEK